MISIRDQLESFEGQVHFLGQRMEEKDGLTPSGIDFGPLHLNIGQSPKSEPVYCPKVTRIVDIEGGTEDIRLFQLVHLTLDIAELSVHTFLLVVTFEEGLG